MQQHHAPAVSTESINMKMNGSYSRSESISEGKITLSVPRIETEPLSCLAHSLAHVLTELQRNFFLHRGKHNYGLLMLAELQGRCFVRRDRVKTRRSVSE